MSFFDTVSEDWKIAHADNGQQVVTLQRRTTASKDTSGGPVSTSFANVAGAQDVPADVQSAGSNVRLRFMQKALVVSHTVYLSRDIGARAGDRIVYGTRTLMIVEGGYETGDMAGWPATAHVQEAVSTP